MGAQHVGDEADFLEFLRVEVGCELIDSCGAGEGDQGALKAAKSCSASPSRAGASAKRRTWDMLALHGRHAILTTNGHRKAIVFDCLSESGCDIVERHKDGLVPGEDDE